MRLTTLFLVLLGLALLVAAAPMTHREKELELKKRDKIVTDLKREESKISKVILAYSMLSSWDYFLPVCTSTT
jgi:hypothetical protein